MTENEVKFNKVLKHIDRNIRDLKEKAVSNKRGAYSDPVCAAYMQRIYGNPEGLHLKITYTHQIAKRDLENSLSKVKLRRRVQVAVMDINETEENKPSYCSQLTQIGEDENGYAYRTHSNSQLPDELQSREDALGSIDDIFGAYTALRSANQIK